MLFMYQYKSIKCVKGTSWGHSNSIMGRVFVSHVADPGSILPIPYCPLRLPGVISEC